MVEFLGWIALAFGGGYIAGGVGFIAGARGGLESIGRGIGIAAICAMTWVCFVAWLSPLTIGFAP